MMLDKHNALKDDDILAWERVEGAVLIRVVEKLILRGLSSRGGL